MLAYASLFAVLDLTVYEVGNVVWKEYRRGRIKNPTLVARLFQEILDNMQVLQLRGKLPEITRLAIDENLAFYDASYLCTARTPWNEASHRGPRPPEVSRINQHQAATKRTTRTLDNIAPRGSAAP